MKSEIRLESVHSYLRSSKVKHHEVSLKVIYSFLLYVCVKYNFDSMMHHCFILRFNIHCIFIFIYIVIHVHITCECWNKIIELN